MVPKRVLSVEVKVDEFGSPPRVQRARGVRALCGQGFYRVMSDEARQPSPARLPVHGASLFRLVARHDMNLMPCLNQRGTNCFPIAPVAPATSTLVVAPSPESYLHPRRQDGSPRL